MPRERLVNFLKHWKLFLLFAGMVWAALYVNSTIKWDMRAGTDIGYSWLEGRRILLGENPYSRIHAGDMRKNDKYATYFPLFYELSFLSQRAGLVYFDDWIAFWKNVFITFEIASAALIFFALTSRSQHTLAVFSTLFWLFNRWTLFQIRVAYFDFIPVFFMAASVWLFSRHRTTSLLFLSISLALKQIAIFLVPLYLIWAWQSVEKNKGKTFIQTASWLVSVPLLTSLPFLFWDAEGFIRSILFSITRLNVDHFSAPTLPVFMNWEGLLARLPMFLMFGLVYLAAWQKKIPLFLATFLVMLAFTEFNPVQFHQYLLWVVVFIPFLAVDTLPPHAQISQR